MWGDGADEVDAGCKSSYIVRMRINATSARRSWQQRCESLQAVWYWQCLRAVQETDVLA